MSEQNYINKLEKGEDSVLLHDSRISEDYEINGITLIRQNILDMFYPIGTIYQSIEDDFNPNTTFGGFWIKIKDCFLFGSSNNYSSGRSGGREFKHTLTEDELPSHSHQFQYEFNDSLSTNMVTYSTFYSFSTTGQENATLTGETNSTGKAAGIGATHLESIGKNQSFDIIPPYLTVNIWKRIG